MTLLEVKNEYMRQLKEKLESSETKKNLFEKIKGANGLIAEKEIEALTSAEAPALYIAVIGTGPLIRENNTLTGEVIIMAYVLTRATDKSSASDEALQRVNAVVIASADLAHNNFVGQASCIETSNIYSKTLQEKELSVWAIKFSHRVILQLTQIETIQRIKTIIH